MRARIGSKEIHAYEQRLSAHLEKSFRHLIADLLWAEEPKRVPSPRFLRGESGKNT